MALIQDDQDTAARPGVTTGAALGAGSLAGFVGGLAMLAVLTTGAAIASEPTAKPGVETGIATVPNAITSFTFDTGIEQFNAGYTWATYPGVALHLLAAVGFGIVGAGLIAALLGRYPDLPGGIFVALLYAVGLQLLFLGGVVDGLQDTDTVHTAAPEAAWWIGHILYGVSLGTVATVVIRRIACRADDFDLSPRNEQGAAGARHSTSTGR